MMLACKPTAPSVVVILDDDSARAAQLRHALAGLPCELAETRCGNDALGRCISDDGVALVLMNANLAGMTSQEVLELLKAEITTRHIPVVVMADPGDAGLRESAFAAGACGFLIRPVDGISLLAKVSGFLDLHRRQHHLRVQLSRSEAMRRFAKDSQVRLRLALDDAPIPIMVHAADGEVVMLNRLWLGMPGYSRGELRNLSAWIARAHPHQAQRARKHFDAVQGSTQDEFEVRTVDGRMLTWEISSGPLAPLPDGRGLVISMAVDVSERKRYETALNQAKLEAERANLAKSRFLAAASHDLRQPLQGLQMYFEVLAATLPDRKHPAAMGLFNCAEILKEQLNQLLDIAKLDSGGLEPSLVECRIGEVLRKVVASQLPSAGGKGLRLKLVPTEAVVRTDPALVERVVLNLVSNAVKYTLKGKVLVGCRHRGGRLVVQVWDTGPGIDEKHREDIFEEFFQIDNPSRDRAKGSGLGLAIVQRIAQSLDLRLDLCSRLGHGSMFAIEFPCSGEEQAI